MRLVSFFLGVALFSACTVAASPGTRKVISNNNDGETTVVNWDTANVYHVAQVSPPAHGSNTAHMHRLVVPKPHSTHHSHLHAH